MKCQVNLSNEMVAKVDTYAKKMGVSRSALCSMLIGQGIMSFDRSMDIVSILGDKLGESLLTERKMKEIAKDLKQEVEENQKPQNE